ncbi:TNT domain-containing protein [Cellulomonas soli]|uniref:TNT domain-containing protein n=1 Tax=Cellulomonas soli TaxID=931535 RepID=A0A512PG17_9CELL|nr:TNT domain-containing protein [Cellulomonas soli]NYI58009.1 hypothetical protein [Cellulomonas soli]GEP70144.1 hypothetical protein CSO01_28590 [Cellulomonas soli]
MSANALVAGPVDTSSSLSGTGVVESVSDLCQSLQSGSWVAIGLSGVGATLDVAAAVVDPIGSLIAAGLGWLMEHLEPLKGWLDDLTGDAGAVLGFAATWDNVAGAMDSASTELDRLVRTDLEAMSGAAITSYATYADDLAQRIRATKDSATSMAGSLRTCATVVQVVHDLVRDTLAQLVGSIISWAAEAVLTLGLATPVIAGQVSTRVSSLATRIGRSVTDVLTSAKSLKNLIEALTDALRRMGTHLKSHLPGGRGATAAATPTPRHPSGMPLSDGAPRSAYDQLRDPHISPSNASIVDARYDPFGGMTREEFLATYRRSDSTTPDGWSWDWPPNNGAVPGSEVRRAVTAEDTFRLDRIGGDGGTYFSPLDTPLDGRALPPDRLNYTRTEFELNTGHETVKDGLLTIETSEIAPWFGQPGGGVQHRFFIGTRELTQKELIDGGLLTRVGTTG